MNRLFRQHLLAAVKAAVAQSRAADAIEHDPTKGLARERAMLEWLILPFLPQSFQVTSGIVTDEHGRQSRQMDIVIYDPRRLAPFSLGPTHGIPIDTCLAAIEVKSKLTAVELDKSMRVADSLRQLSLTQPSEHDRTSMVLNQAGQRRPTPVPPLMGVFAFDSDLKGTAGGGTKSELDRYREHDDHTFTTPRLQFICVVGRGYWRVNGQDRANVAWAECLCSPDHDEVIDCIGVLLNSLHGVAETRVYPPFGSYVIKSRRWSTILHDGRCDHEPPPSSKDERG